MIDVRGYERGDAVVLRHSHPADEFLSIPAAGFQAYPTDDPMDLDGVFADCVTLTSNREPVGVALISGEPYTSVATVSIRMTGRERGESALRQAVGKVLGYLRQVRGFEFVVGYGARLPESFSSHAFEWFGFEPLGSIPEHLWYGGQSHNRDVYGRRIGGGAQWT